MSADEVERNPLPFEEALTRLEKLVAEMESGKLGLDDTMQRYAEGMALAETCSRKLNEAEKKIEILVKKTGENDARWREFRPDEPRAARSDAG
jgi:exodeoxyribonuclease VII small subunit